MATWLFLLIQRETGSACIVYDTMKKIILSIGIICCSQLSNAQADSVKYAREINEQVWKPFIHSLITGDKQGLRDVHSKRIMRVEIDRNKIIDYDKYFPPVSSDSANRPKMANRDFILRFDKRISNGERAWESGIYKGSVTIEGKRPRVYYGRFFVVLEKEGGTWKIIVDADTAKGADEPAFNAASAME